MTTTNPLVIPTYTFIKKDFNRFTNLIYENRHFNHSLLNESLSMFEGQYEIAKHLSNIAYNMSKHEVKKNIISVSEFNTWLKTITLIVNIDCKNLLNHFSANLNKVGTDDAEIEVNIPFKYYNIDDSVYIKNKLLYCITHELMHDNIFIKRYQNGISDYDDTPNDYQTYITIMRENDPDSLLYKFALALYSTFYQETQAIISQTSVNLRLIYNKEKLTNNEIRNGISKTEGYNRFQTILYDLVPTLENMTDDELFTNIELPLFSMYSITINPKKYIKRFKHISETAIKKIIKNTMFLSNNL